MNEFLQTTPAIGSANPTIVAAAAAIGGSTVLVIAGSLHVAGFLRIHATVRSLPPLPF
ncbi:MAG: hypothetical protein ABIO94_14080 [Opitutaceae bacterium]